MTAPVQIHKIPHLLVTEDFDTTAIVVYDGEVVTYDDQVVWYG